MPSKPTDDPPVSAGGNIIAVAPAGGNSNLLGPLLLDRACPGSVSSTPFVVSRDRNFERVDFAVA